MLTNTPTGSDATCSPMEVYCSGLGTFEADLDESMVSPGSEDHSSDVSGMAP